MPVAGSCIPDVSMFPVVPKTQPRSVYLAFRNETNYVGEDDSNISPIADFRVAGDGRSGNSPNRQHHRQKAKDHGISRDTHITVYYCTVNR